jgi:hypothetical protein
VRHALRAGKIEGYGGWFGLLSFRECKSAVSGVCTDV